MDASYNPYFDMVSKALLFVSGTMGAFLILFFVLKAYFQRRKLEASLALEVPESA